MCAVPLPTVINPIVIENISYIVSYHVRSSLGTLRHTGIYKTQMKRLKF